MFMKSNTNMNYNFNICLWNQIQIWITILQNGLQGILKNILILPNQIENRKESSEREIECHFWEQGGLSKKKWIFFLIF